MLPSGLLTFDLSGGEAVRLKQGLGVSEIRHEQGL